MKAFLDTSVLVPVFYGDHAHHAASLALFTKFPKKEVGCGAHSLLEVYATLTRMPGKHRISSKQGMLFITNIRECATLFSLTADEYGDMLQKFTSIGIVGGTIYDALLATCALKEPSRNNIYNLTWSFGGWLRCSLVTDPFGYAPRSRLASRQNPGVLFVNVIS